MSKDDIIKAEGKIIKLLPNAQFQVELENGTEIIGHLSGKMRVNYIRIMLGDVVNIEISPYDLTKGRITFRKKGV